MAILYLEDWERYPSAIADVHTKNETWVQQAYKFQAMGVANWYFHLALYNPALVGVDVYSENLTLDQKNMIMMECMANPWYIFREVLRIPDGEMKHYLEANRGNIAMFWCVLNSFITYVQQIRQTGKSLNTRFLIVAFHMFLAEGGTHILFTKGDLRRDEIKYYKKYRDCLPKWMWYLTPKDTDNQQEFTTLMNGNQTYSYVPQSSVEDANGVGRGKTPDFITVDEVPFLANAETSLSALLGSTGDSFKKARKFKKFHAILYTTTAGDLSTASGKFVYNNIKKKAMYFSEMLYDSRNRDDAIDVIMANSKCEDRAAPYVDISFNHLQLGITDAELRSRIAVANGSIDKTRRDFLGQWTFGSANNPIHEKLLKRIRDAINVKPINEIDDKYRFIVKYHKDPDYVKGRTTIMGLDTSNAIGRDAITGVMVDVETTEVLATFMVGESNLVTFSIWLAKFIQNHPNMTLIPEARGSWDGIRDQLLIELPMMGIDPGRRIYNRIVDAKDGTDSEKRTYREYSSGAPSERKYFPYRSMFGFPTSGTLRETLYVDIFKAATREGPTLIRDPMLIDELSGLVEKNDRIDHASSGHDDHVISWLMAHWLIRIGRNLEHYGINTRLVMGKLKFAAGDESPKQLAKVIKQDKLAIQILELEEKLNNARGGIEIKYLEAKIASLKSEVRNDDVTEVGSIDRKSDQAEADRAEEARQNHRPMTNYKFNPFTYKGR